MSQLKVLSLFVLAVCIVHAADTTLDAVVARLMPHQPGGSPPYCEIKRLKTGDEPVWFCQTRIVAIVGPRP
jgi:hypothetical protein